MQVGEEVSFKAANGEVFTGTIVKVWSDSIGRPWWSVKTPESQCPFPVTEDQLPEVK